jgi:hypothetical protein
MNAMRLNGCELQAQADEILVPATEGAREAFLEILSQIADPELRDSIESAVNHYACALTDAAIVVGWQIATEPQRWLFRSKRV